MVPVRGCGHSTCPCDAEQIHTLVRTKTGASHAISRAGGMMPLHLYKDQGPYTKSLVAEAKGQPHGANHHTHSSGMAVVP